MSIEILVFSDNAAESRFFSEHGLSLGLVLSGGKELWLWDCGGSDVFIKNAQAMSVSLSEAKGIAFSHGHYDHVDGYAHARKAWMHCSTYMHPGALRERYAIYPGEAPKRVSVAPDVARALQESHWVERYAQLTPVMGMITDILRQPGNFQAVEHFYYDSQGKEPDAVPDDGCLVIGGKRGAILVLGCCHSGLANTMDCAAKRVGIAHFYAVVGGMHLMRAERWAVEEAAETLRRYAVERVHPGHCTGASAIKALQEMLPGKVFPLAAGQRLKL